MDWLWYPEVLPILIAILALVGALGLAFIYGVRHRLAWAQLPAAARDPKLATLVIQREAELLEKEERLERVNEQLRDGEARLLERGQPEAEVAYWNSQVVAVKAEHAGLDALRAETEEVRERFRREMENLADAERQAREAKGELEDARMRVAEAERRLGEIAKEEGRAREAHKELVRATAEMETGLTAKGAECKAVLEALDQGRGQLARIEPELKTLAARRQSLHAELRGDEERLATVKAELEALEPGRQVLAEHREALQSVERDLNEKQETLAGLESEEARLNVQIARHRMN